MTGYGLAVTAPGQGVQRAGMLDPWLEASPRAAELLAEWSVVAGFDLVRAGRDEAALADTAVAQPLIVVTALLSLDALRRAVPIDAGRAVYAGHSVGELSAAAGAGYLTPATAIGLARGRGSAMSAACATARTGMAAVVPRPRDGASDEAIEAAIRAAGLVLANRNGSHQFVAAGPVDRLEAFCAAAPAGLRILPLEVAGAFHTAAMAPAEAPFGRAVRESRFDEPAAAMVSNRDGALVAGPADLRDRLVAQITAPVRWDLCSATIGDLCAPDVVYVELAPAGPLTRLVERDRPGARTVALRSPDDLDSVPRTQPA